MGLLGSFTTRSDGQTITAAMWNNDFTQVRDWANTYALHKDVAGTVSVTHTYSASQTFSAGFTAGASSSIAGNMTLSGTSMRLIFYESDQAADEKRWDVFVNGKVMTWRVVNDADNSSSPIYTITRGTGTAVTLIEAHAPLTVTGGVTGGGFLLNSTGNFGNGQFYKDTVYGAIVGGASGSTSDSAMTDDGGFPRVRVTNTGVDLVGAVTMSSTLTVSGTISGVTTLTATTGNITTVNATTGNITTVTATTGNITTVTATNLAGTLTTAAQANVTSVGTLTSLTVSGEATFNGNVVLGNAAGDTITVNGTIAGTLNNTGQPRVTAYRASGATVANGDPLPFSHETGDVGSMHDTGSNTERITIPSGAGGVYLVSVHLIPNATWAASGTWYVVKNGTTNVLSGSVVSGEFRALVIHGIVDVIAGDYLTVVNNSGASQTLTYDTLTGVSPRFQVAKLW